MIVTKNIIWGIIHQLNHLGIVSDSRIGQVINSLAQFNGKLVIVNVSHPQKYIIEGNSLQTNVKYMLGDNFISKYTIWGPDLLNDFIYISIKDMDIMLYRIIYHYMNFRWNLSRK